MNRSGAKKTSKGSSAASSASASTSRTTPSTANTKSGTSATKKPKSGVKSASQLGTAEKPFTIQYLPQLPPAPSEADLMRFPPGAGEPKPAPDPRLKFVMQRKEKDPHDA